MVEIENIFLAEALHVFRVVARLTQKELSKAIGKDENWVKDLEQGEIEITDQLLEELCPVLGATPTKVFKSAVDLKEMTKVPERELLQRIREEVEYELWKREQNEDSL